MKKAKANKDDELRPEYDLKNLKVRKLGPDRKSFGRKSDLKETKIESILQSIDQRTHRMSQTFAEVVEGVKQLSPAEKEALRELLNKFLIEDVRNGVRRHSGSAKGKIFMSSDFDEPLEDFAEYME